MTLGTRESLLAIKPTLKTIKINETDYFIREFTVGEMNEALYGQQKALQKLADEQGIELAFDDQDELAKQLSKIYDPHRLARTLATRLCNKDGVNLFDPESKADLEQLSKLDKSVFEQLNNAIKEEEPKNSQPDASSS